MTQRNWIGVTCQFLENGRVQIQRVQINDQWVQVGQGRQWTDENGRHVLVMLPNQTVREIVLRADALRWELRPDHTAARPVV